MTTHRTAGLLRQLHRLTAFHEIEQLADRDLVRRFLAQRDEAAFEALLRRHGAMVLRVCRRVLHDEHDAEDAFQATFLLLARKASSLRSQASVASWLHGVAYRVALKARAGAGRRRFHESQAAGPSTLEPDVLADVTLRETEKLLDEELARLPEKYRTPLVLCCLEGKTRDEAAGLLGWSSSLIKSRLEEARGLLRCRLRRRGLVLSVPLLASALARQTASAAVTPELAAATVRAAVSFAGPGVMSAGVVPAPVAALTEGVLQAMWMSKIKLAAAVVLAVGLVGAGSGWLAHRTLAAGVPGAQTSRQGADPDRPKQQKGADPATPGPRWKRTVRWQLNFSTDNGEDYAGQLAALGATVAIPDGDSDTRYRVFRDLSQRPARGEVEDIVKNDRLFWIESNSKSLTGLGKVLGWKEVPKHMVVFFPRYVEDDLLRKELAFANRKEEEIQETEFRIRRTATGYEVEVVGQSAKADPRVTELAELREENARLVKELHQVRMELRRLKVQLDLMTNPQAGAATPDGGLADVSVVLRAGKETKYQHVENVLEALKKLKVGKLKVEIVGPIGVSAVIQAPGKTPYAAVEKVIEALKGAGVEKVDCAVDP
jgi:RNA polymerase sigma factor (sigma-70 family)